MFFSLASILKAYQKVSVIILRTNNILNKFSANLCVRCGNFLTAKSAEAAKSFVEQNMIVVIFSRVAFGQPLAVSLPG